MLNPKKMKDKEKLLKKPKGENTLLTEKKNHIKLILQTIVSKKRMDWSRVLREKISPT